MFGVVINPLTHVENIFLPIKLTRLTHSLQFVIFVFISSLFWMFMIPVYAQTDTIGLPDNSPVIPETTWSEQTSGTIQQLYETWA